MSYFIAPNSTLKVEPQGTNPRNCVKECLGLLKAEPQGECKDLEAP